MYCFVRSSIRSVVRSLNVVVVVVVVADLLATIHVFVYVLRGFVSVVLLERFVSLFSFYLSARAHKIALAFQFIDRAVQPHWKEW